MTLDKFPDGLVQGGKITTYRSVMANFFFSATISQRDINGVFVNIKPYIRATLFHDLPPWLWLCSGEFAFPA